VVGKHLASKLFRPIQSIWEWCRRADAIFESAEKPSAAWVKKANTIVLCVGMAIVLAWVYLMPMPPRFARFVMVFFAIFETAMWFWNLWRFRSLELEERRRMGLCVSCGFDLRRSDNRCPECGKPISHSERKHQNFNFEATEAGFVVGREFLKVWLTCDESQRLLSFEGATRDSSNPEIFIVLDREAHSTDGRIHSCSLSRAELRMELTGYFSNRYDKFEVKLRIPENQWINLAEGLKAVIGAACADLLIDRIA
jgi:predicted RNA-binding Zn-ribbon protein involved in translation (DUF1610 family)